jgi:predicted alpha/beta-fold hydrolase
MCRRPEIVMAASGFNDSILSQCPTLLEVYNAFPFLTNGHVETIFAAFFRRNPGVKYSRRCLIMDDGGTVTLDFEHLTEEEVRLRSA